MRMTVRMLTVMALPQAVPPGVSPVVPIPGKGTDWDRGFFSLIASNPFLRG